MHINKTISRFKHRIRIFKSKFLVLFLRSIKYHFFPQSLYKCDTTTIDNYLISLQRIDYYEKFKKINQNISMLHPDVLALLDLFAANIKGSVLELGAYVGGSTVVIAQAIKPNTKYISVEIGGSHAHPTHPSDDIYKDLLSNLKKYGVFEKVRVINGDANDKYVKDRVKNLLNKSKLSLMLIDTSGNIERDFCNYAKYCEPGCIVVIDDYVSLDDAKDLKSVYPGYSANKDHLTSQVLNKCVENGYLIKIGLYGWGTWIGYFTEKGRVYYKNVTDED